MDSIRESLQSLRRMNKRQLTLQILNLMSVPFMAYMLFMAISIYANTDSPVVVVLSGSMRPAFERGDILFVSDCPREPTKLRLQSGDIVVFKVSDKPIPIVHRILNVHQKVNGDVWVLTKGDNNNGHDRSLYARNQEWLRDKDILGRIVGYFPYLGMCTISMTDYPQLKYLLFAILGFITLTSRE